jgi:hypothetical protein
VCFTPDAAADAAALLRCMECGVRAHRACYGAWSHSPADGGEGATAGGVTCDACLRGARRPACRLCSLRGGALKPMALGGWAHPACALWVPGAGFDSGGSGEGGEGGGAGRARVSFDAGRVPKAHWGRLCELCFVSDGVVVACAQRGCKSGFHALCALEAGAHMPRAGAAGGGRPAGAARCGKHRPDARAREGATDLVSGLLAAAGHPQPEPAAGAGGAREPAGAPLYCEPLYCVCRRPYAEGAFMLECEACGEWFHGACVGVAEELADALDAWQCAGCARASGPRGHAEPEPEGIQ